MEKSVNSAKINKRSEIRHIFDHAVYSVSDL